MSYFHVISISLISDGHYLVNIEGFKKIMFGRRGGYTQILPIPRGGIQISPIIGGGQHPALDDDTH